MKFIKLFFSIALIVVISANISAQTGAKTTGPKTETFKVWGNCVMCKDRIEKAVKSEGATSAVWDVKTKMLTVSYDPSKTNVVAIDKKLASVGHDTEKFKTDDKTYDALPGCCHYDRAK